MINVVTGVGPRVGSSYVMQQCAERGLDVKYDSILEQMLPKEGNPNGYYEYNPMGLSNLQSGVVKVWPLFLHMINPKKIVVLQRDRSAKQYDSIRKQAIREGGSVYPPEWVEQSVVALLDYLPHTEAEVRVFKTEKLNDTIDDIIKFLGD